MNPKLRKLIGNIQSERLELARVANSGRVPVLHEPPRSSDLARAVERMVVPPPTSYREFLESHNGWEKFLGGFCLIGVSGQHTKEAREDIKITVEEDGWAQKDAFPKEARNRFAAMEAKDRSFFYLRNHLIIGTDFNGQLCLFDSRTADAKKGEMELVLWSPDGITERHGSFVRFLEKVLEETREELAKRRR